MGFDDYVSKYLHSMGPRKEWKVNRGKEVDANREMTLFCRHGVGGCNRVVSLSNSSI